MKPVLPLIAALVVAGLVITVAMGLLNRLNAGVTDIDDDIHGGTV